jgi:hypothetical protein
MKIESVQWQGMKRTSTNGFPAGEHFIRERRHVYQYYEDRHPHKSGRLRPNRPIIRQSINGGHDQHSDVTRNSHSSRKKCCIRSWDRSGLQCISQGPSAYPIQSQIEINSECSRQTAFSNARGRSGSEKCVGGGQLPELRQYCT